MTKQDLNRDIKILANEIYRMSFESQEKYFEYLEKTASKEFKRLYGADSNFEEMNILSIKIMLRLNVSHKFVPLHNFGIHIELSKII